MNASNRAAHKLLFDDRLFPLGQESAVAAQIRSAREILSQAADQLSGESFQEEKALESVCSADDALQEAWAQLNRAEDAVFRAMLWLRDSGERTQVFPAEN